MAKIKFLCNPIKTAVWYQAADDQDSDHADCNLNDQSPGWKGISTDNGVGYEEMEEGKRYCIQYYLNSPEYADENGSIKIYSSDDQFMTRANFGVSSGGKAGGFCCFRVNNPRE